MRAIGSRLSSFTSRSDITITNAAPSDVCDELPAVTLPPATKTGLSLAKASTLVSARGPSSLLTVNSRVFFVPVLTSK
jgi:hypothetical protein